jgi:hypothetical protein
VVFETDRLEENGYTFDWDFGDGTTGTGAVVSHMYNFSTNTTITVQLTVTGACGTVTYSQSLQFKDNVLIGGRMAAPSQEGQEVPDMPSLEEIEVFPNPFSNELTFTYPMDENQYGAVLVNTLGQRVAMQALPDGTGEYVWTLPNQMANGIYLVVITKNGQPWKSTKMVKK